jgi:phosphate ABC transporter phosphate-binding protein
MRAQHSTEPGINFGHPIPVRPTNSGWPAIMVALFVLAFHLNLAQAQPPHNLHDIHAIYVAPSATGDAANAIRNRLIDRLKKSGAIRVVDNAGSADAILQSTSVIWPTGNVSLNPRSNSTVLTNYQGYLSAELTDSAHQALWSYLVTPSRFRMSNIVDDLADQLTTRLLEAIRTGMPAPNAPSTANSASNPQRATLHAAGATFPAPLYLKWFESFAQDQGGFPITYNAIGSVAGIEQLIAGKVDMAASDIPSTQDQGASQLLHFPTVVGGVVPIYNLPGAGRTLNLTPQVLADIYSGKIRKWNDARIREWNGGAHLPDEEIAVIHRSDGSGTTFAWTSFLAATSADWKARVGASIDWPAGTGATGNEGVAEQVAKTPNAIGYVELIYAVQHRLSYAAVRNPAGRFIKADLESITAAAASSSAHDPGSSALNASSKGAYPITTFTWLLVPEAGGNPTQRAAIAAFLRWMLTTGQKQCSSLGYAPLPRQLAMQELQSLSALK